MAYPVTKAAAGIYPQAGIEKLKRSGGGDLEAEKQRLRKATKEFESLFMYEMLKTMRKTIPKDDSSEKAGFSGDLGKETFMQMFDMELARKMADGGQGSISDLLYNSLENVIKVQNGLEPLPITLKPLKGSPQRSAALIRRQKSISLPPSRPISIRRRAPGYLPIRSSVAERAADPILSRFGRYIDEAARQTSLDSSLIYAVIKTESDGDPRAVSPAGAKGLMQLVDSTLRDYRVSRAFDPRENILAGSKYLKHLLDRFGDLKLALAAYNAGPRNVERHNGVPPFEETRAYIDKVMDRLTSLHRTPPSREAKVPTENIR